MIRGAIHYTRPAPGPEKNGVFVGDSKQFALTTAAFREQHGAVRYGGEGPQALHNELYPVEVPIADGRESRFELMNDGFGLAVADLGPADDVGRYKTRLESVVRAACRADFAKAFAHTARNWAPTPEVKAMGFGNYVHTDVGTESWAARLASLDPGELPPGLTAADARRALAAERYAVVTAWRYLGPDPHCVKSHLAVLDHDTLDPDDVIDFELHARNHTFGANYRLKHNPNHRFYYFPRMSREAEVLLFLAFDSAAAGPLLRKTPAPSIFHSAFIDPDLGDAPNDRQSLDVRLLVVWDVWD